MRAAERKAAAAAAAAAAQPPALVQTTDGGHQQVVQAIGTVGAVEVRPSDAMTIARLVHPAPAVLASPAATKAVKSKRMREPDNAPHSSETEPPPRLCATVS